VCFRCFSSSGFAYLYIGWVSIPFGCGESEIVRGEGNNAYDKNKCMVIEVYDDWLAAPLKCGTRYLSKLNMKIVRSGVNALNSRQVTNPFMKLEYFVIRNPIEHLESALHTECLPHIDNFTEIRRVLDTFNEDYEGGTHYHMELYKKVYDFWCQRKYSFEFVELTRLTYTMSDKGYHIPFYPDEYNFGYYGEKWKSKEAVSEIIKNEFREDWDKLMDCAKNDLHYYQNCQSKVKKFI